MAVLTNVAASLSANPHHSIGAALSLLLVFAIRSFLVRLDVPSTAPKVFAGRRLIGSLDFSTSRFDYLRQGKEQSEDGQFSFWYGSNHVVAVSGNVARADYLTARGLDSLAGFIALLGNFLNVSQLTNSISRQVLLICKRCTQDDHISSNLHHLVTDTDVAFRNLGSSGVTEPVKSLGRLTYQLTHRMVGSHDIVRDPKLVDKTIGVYRHLEEDSIIDVLFPLLPTLSKLRRLYGYAMLQRTMVGILKKRRQAGRVENDAMQLMMDQGSSDTIISLAMIGFILAGVFNSSLNTAWNLCCYAKNPDYLARTRQEIHAVMEKHRQSPTDTNVDIFSRLTLEEWETEFPLLELGLKETMRLTMSGTIVRKNIGGKDVQIGGTDCVIPKNSVAVYGAADVHLNPEIYRNPLEWDPERYGDERAEGADVPHSFLGWGSGNHPCPAMRFAKLDVMVPTVMFIATYDFSICDTNGDNLDTPLPKLEFNRVGAGRPSKQVYLKYNVQSPY